MISQVYVPDPASVGQHMADVAAEMVRRGWRVVVLTANRGYEDSTVKYSSREVIEGVEVRRLPMSSFGKKSIPLRVLGGVLFLLQVIVHGWLTRRLSCLLISTSPPMCSVAALMITAIRRVPIKYWVMDLNPDQLIALGWAKAGALSVRLLNILNRMILKRAANVITLDRFMAKRLIAKWPDIKAKLVVMSPWPHDQHLETIEHRDNPFRSEHGLNDKFVIMFSGNLSIASPVDTVLEAALQLQDKTNLIFLFVGGGLGKKQLEYFLAKHRPTNIVSLSYQPLSTLKYSLSAANVHLVSMGEAIVGICHPCKVYGAMAVSRPILFLGPDDCHVTDILRDKEIGWHIRHGDVPGTVRQIRSLLQTDQDKLAAMGATAKCLVDQRLSRSALCGAFCDTIESGVVVLSAG